jgi:hypothetical protein
MELKQCWVVRNPNMEFADEYNSADDLVYETTADGLVSLVIGTETVPGRWVGEQTKIHTAKDSAMADAEERFAKLLRELCSQPWCGNASGDSGD